MPLTLRNLFSRSKSGYTNPTSPRNPSSSENHRSQQALKPKARESFRPLAIFQVGSSSRHRAQTHVHPSRRPRSRTRSPPDTPRSRSRAHSRSHERPRAHRDGYSHSASHGASRAHSQPRRSEAEGRPRSRSGARSYSHSHYRPSHSRHDQEPRYSGSSSSRPQYVHSHSAPAPRSSGHAPHHGTYPHATTTTPRSILRKRSRYPLSGGSHQPVHYGYGQHHRQQSAQYAAHGTPHYHTLTQDRLSHHNNYNDDLYAGSYSPRTRREVRFGQAYVHVLSEHSQYSASRHGPSSSYRSGYR